MLLFFHKNIQKLNLARDNDFIHFLHLFCFLFKLFVVGQIFIYIYTYMYNIIMIFPMIFYFINTSMYCKLYLHIFN